MNNAITLIIPGKPVGKMRPRRSPHGHWYNPQKDIMEKTKLIIKKQLPENFTIIKKKIPVKILILFLFNPTKSEKKVPEFHPYCKKPDLDNAEKFVMDILSKVVIHDDNQIFLQTSEKRYTLESERTEIEVSW